MCVHLSIPAVTYDGRLAFATNLGKVGVTESSIFDPSRMFGGRNTLAYLQLGQGEEDDTEVSNNIQVRRSRRRPLASSVFVEGCVCVVCV